MTNQSKKFTVMAVKNEGSGKVTAFFKELPGLVVQDTSPEDAKVKLSILLDSYIKRLESSKNNMEIQTTSFV